MKHTRQRFAIPKSNKMRFCSFCAATLKTLCSAGPSKEGEIDRAVSHPFAARSFSSFHPLSGRPFAARQASLRPVVTISVRSRVDAVFKHVEQITGTSEDYVFDSAACKNDVILVEVASITADALDLVGR